jgi:ribosomal protein S18 acetylase RimI-like enzyme
MTTTLIPAERFTIEELTEAYNQTRVDYMIPMPMNAARLREYVHNYHIDLEQSLVAVQNGTIFGLGMLGVRDNRSWITRLGLVANQRGKGIGELVMRGLISNSDDLGLETNLLEVIRGNVPAHTLFKKLGFKDVRELLILRRPPGNLPEPTAPAVELDVDACIALLGDRRVHQAWTNQTESLIRVGKVKGFQVEVPGAGSGWIVFQPTLFNLSRLMFGTYGEDRMTVIRVLLAHLHNTYPNQDTYTENIPADDPHLPAFEEIGYIEAFRRVEMLRRAGLN